MFDVSGTGVVDRDWVDDEPLPGDEGYESFRAYEAQQDAFWSAVGLGQIPVADGRPDLTAARTDGALLAAARSAARAVAVAEGARLRAISTFLLRRIANPEIGHDEAAMAHSAQAELGLAFGISPTEAATDAHLALTLTRRLPGTFAALEAGVIGLRKVNAIVDESLNLTLAQCARLEDAVLPRAEHCTLRTLKNRVRRAVEKIDADAVRKRREAAKASRALWVSDGHDGMATLCLYLPTAQAHAAYDAINAAIPAQRTDPGDDRTIDARRADHALDLLSAALGIDLRAAADAATSADGADGAVLSAAQIAHLDRGANNYVPNEDLKDAIRARDKHCRFPGCHRPAVHCDIDHTVAFKIGGRTVYLNLGCICRFHHRIKHMPGWHVTQDRDAVFTWTSPTGQVFTTRPPPPGGDEAPDMRPAPTFDDDTPPF